MVKVKVWGIKYVIVSLVQREQGLEGAGVESKERRPYYAECRRGWCSLLYLTIHIRSLVNSSITR